MGGWQWRWGRGWDQPYHFPLPHPLFSAAAGPGWAVGSQGAQLLLEVSGGVREPNPGLLLPRPALHLSFTHLVCRSAMKVTSRAPPSQGPAHPQHPCCVGSIFTAGGLAPCPVGGLAVTLDL